MAGSALAPRPVNAADKIDAIDALANGLQPLFNDFADRAFDYPGFIAGDEDRTPLGDAVRGVARANCRAWAAADKSGYSTRVNAGNAELCGPYLDGLGEKPTDGTIGPPFSGGQCPVVYVVTYTATQDGATTDPASIAALGPVRGIRGRISETGARIVELNCRGVNLGSPTCIGVGNTGQGWYLLSGLNSAGSEPTAKIVSVSPCSGLDNCGDPEPEIQPPATVTPTTPIPPSITINLPGLGPVDVTVTINPTGDPQVCIPVLGVCEDFTIGVPGGGGGAGDGALPPGDVGDPGSGGTAGAGGDAEGEAPPGKVLTGLRLNLEQIPLNPKEYAPGVYRGVCYVYMGTPDGLDHDPAGAMVADGQFVYAERENLTRWRVSANTGYEVFVVPYYREVE